MWRSQLVFTFCFNCKFLHFSAVCYISLALLILIVYINPGRLFLIFFNWNSNTIRMARREYRREKNNPKYICKRIYILDYFFHAETVIFLYATYIQFDY